MDNLKNIAKKSCFIVKGGRGKRQLFYKADDGSAHKVLSYNRIPLIRSLPTKISPKTEVISVKLNS